MSDEAAAVSVVEEQIAALTSDLDGLDARELAERLQVLERLSRRLEHSTVTLVGEADRRGVWAEDGHRNVRGWCMAAANWSYGDTSHRIRSAELLDDIAQCGAALASGQIGVAQLRELARARSNPRCGDQLTDCAELLLTKAEMLPYDEFRRVVQRWESLADADGAHRDHEQTHNGRTVSFEPVGAGWHLNARGGAAQGATMKEIFDRFVEAEFLADWEDARDRLGDDVTPSDLARTAAQRRFDALFAIFEQAASCEPDARAPEPIVDIIVDQVTFEAALRAMAEDRPLSDTMPPVTDPTIRRCETTDGDPVDPLDAVAAALVGHVRRVVFDGRSCVINLGTSSRLFRGSSRHAAWLLGTRCIWPGCGLRHCQVDHSVPRCDGGPTDPSSAGPLCGRHNRWKSRGYHTWRDPDGHWHTVRPDGTEILAA